MKGSYFVPTFFLGVILLVAGLYGIIAYSVTPKILERRDSNYFKYIKDCKDRVDLRRAVRFNREERTSLITKHIKLHSISIILIGTIFIIWAIDRRVMYSRLQINVTNKRKIDILTRLIGLVFFVFLIIFATAASLQLRSLMPEWVNFVRYYKVHKNSERIRVFLEENGIPVSRVSWGTGKSRNYKYIYLEGSEVKNISILSNLAVTHLTLRNTQVTDLTPLRKCPLVHLDLEGTPVKDISVLSGDKIRSLYLIRTNVSNLEPLNQMPNLKKVKLTEQQIMDNLEVLRNLDISVKDGERAFSTNGTRWLEGYESGEFDNTE